MYLNVFKMHIGYFEVQIYLSMHVANLKQLSLHVITWCLFFDKYIYLYFAINSIEW